jgi:hypothetical protein
MGARRADSFRGDGTSLNAAFAGIVTVTAIYTAALEIQFDAPYGKAWLSMLRAHTGTIGSFINHAQLNVTGKFQMIPAWGNLLGAAAMERYLQLFGLAAAPGRRVVVESPVRHPRPARGGRRSVNPDALLASDDH